MASAVCAGPVSTGLTPDAVFSDYPTMATSSELVQRMASPHSVALFERLAGGRILGHLRR